MEPNSGAIGENAADQLHPNRPILELEPAPGQKISFLALDNFHPQAPKTSEIFPISPLVERYRNQSDQKLALNRTYQQTISEHGWQDKTFTFAYNYFSTLGAEHAKKLGVTDMTQLTPKQAIDLTLRMVVDLTRFSNEDTNNNNHLSTEQFRLTRADESTVLELLEEGLHNKDNNKWKGNGVCRNFAAMTQAVFESLKSHQQPHSMLQNTYILYNSGYEFAPKREGKLDSGIKFAPGHAWNSLVTVEPSGATKSTIVDATWADIDYDSGKMLQADQTMLRMETLVFEAAHKFDQTTPNKDAQLQEVLRYYMQNIASPDSAGGHASPTEIQLFFANQAIRLGLAQQIRQFPEGLNPLLGVVYTPLGAEMQAMELAELWRINQRSEQKYDFTPVLTDYSRNIRLSDYNAHDLLVRDDTFQRRLIEAIKTRPEFTEFLEDSPSFRARVRELHIPGMLPPFNPKESIADYFELEYLAGKSHVLQNRMFLPKVFSSDKINPDFVKGLYTIARTVLRNENLPVYESIEWMNDYDIVKNFTKFYAEAVTEKKK